MVGKAEFLVSGDGDLLNLADQSVCHIITPDEFIKRRRMSLGWLPFLEVARISLSP